MIAYRASEPRSLGASELGASEPRSLGASEPRSLGASEPRSLGASEPRSRVYGLSNRGNQLQLVLHGAPLYDRLRPACKALFRNASFALFLTTPAWAAIETSGSAARGELIRCPDWERLAPPVVLASVGEGQDESDVRGPHGPSGSSRDERGTVRILHAHRRRRRHARGDFLCPARDGNALARNHRIESWLEAGPAAHRAGTETSVQRRRRGRGGRRGTSSRPRRPPGTPAESPFRQAWLRDRPVQSLNGPGRQRRRPGNR